jgi:hypothetical protein
VLLCQPPAKVMEGRPVVKLSLAKFIQLLASESPLRAMIMFEAPVTAKEAKHWFVPRLMLTFRP